MLHTSMTNTTLKIIEKIVKEWQRHEELLVQFNKLSLDEKENISIC